MSFLSRTEPPQGGGGGEIETEVKGRNGKQEQKSMDTDMNNTAGDQEEV